MPQYHINLVWNTMWIEFLFANHYKNVIPFKNARQYKIILSKLVSPGMISTSSNSYSYLQVHFLSLLTWVRGGFCHTEEQGDLIMWRVNTWNTLSTWSQGKGIPDRHIPNCWSRYLPDTHATTQPLGQGRRSPLLQQVYQQFQPEITLKQHEWEMKRGNSLVKLIWVDSPKWKIGFLGKVLFKSFISQLLFT